MKDETTKNSLTALTTKMLKAVEDASQAVGTSVLALSSEPCQYISCALGQLVADGVRAVANKGVAVGQGSGLGLSSWQCRYRNLALT